MGKKPVLGLIGMVWAGIALTGCGECCRNHHNKYNSTPTFGAKSSAANTPAPGTGGRMMQDAPGAGSTIIPARGPDTGASGFQGGVQPAGGNGGAMSSLPGGNSGMPAAPPMPGERQESLSPVNDRAGASGLSSMPGRSDDVGRMPGTPVSRPSIGGDRSIAVPPRPVVNTTPSTGASMPEAPPPVPVPEPPSQPSGSPLPPLGGASSPLSAPPSALPSSLPPR